MKKIMIVVAVLFALFSLPAHAGNVEQGVDGSLRVRATYAPTDITVSPEAMKYDGVWQQAIKEPGVLMPVPSTKTVSYRMVDWFHQEVRTTAKVALVFNEKAKVVEVVKDAVLKSSEQFNSFFIFWVIAVLAMVVSNVLLARGANVAVAAFAVAVFAAFATAATAATLAVVAFATAFAIVAFAFATTVEGQKNKNATMFLSAVFYVCMALAAWAMMP